MDKIPPAPWTTTTFLGALRHDRMVAPGWQPIDGSWFLACVEQISYPTLNGGSFVVLDNLSSHKSDKVRQLIEAASASLRYLPKYLPDLHPIENAFPKLQAALRRAAERSTKALWERIGKLVANFTPQKCANYFNAARYAPI